jgi:transposase
MDAKELQRENERLKKLFTKSRNELTQSQNNLADVTVNLERVKAQRQSVESEFVEQLDDKDHKIASLQHQIKILLRQIKGSRQERIDPDQLFLFSIAELQELAQQLKQGDAEEDLIDDDSSPGRGRPKSRGRVGKLPEFLEREIIRHELSEQERYCSCCGETRDEIGVVSSEQLEIVPAKLKVIQHDRVKYACRTCEENVTTADKPPQPIEKGLPGPGLCAHTVLSKFGDHQPLYRQEDIHSRLGMKIRRSTLCGWQMALSNLALPLVGRMKFLVLQSKVIHTDDTSIKMLQPGKGIALTAKFWPYLGDWLHPYAVYDFTTSRERDGPLKFLSSYEGYLQADAYSGYDCIYASRKVHEVACWVHARRYWYRARDNDPIRANTALGFIARLSQIETQLRSAYPAQNLQGERDFDSVASARQQHALPILNEFKDWLDAEIEGGRILPKSEIRKAFTYTLNQWNALVRYTEKGYLSYDNNAAERLVKIPALGRKNYLFVGGARGGASAAVLYSLVSSAKANGVEPFAWLRDLFARLPYHRGGSAVEQSAAGKPVTSPELDDLLPDNWLRRNPEHKWAIDEIRRAERKRRKKRRKRLQ